MQLPEVFIQELLDFFYVEEKIYLRLLSKNWKFNIELSLTLEYAESPKQRGESISRIGKWLSSFSFLAPDFSLAKQIAENCFRLESVEIYSEINSQPSAEEFTFLNHILLKRNVQELKVYELNCDLSTLLRGSTLKSLMINQGDLENTDFKESINNISNTNLLKLELSCDAVNIQTSRFIETKFPHLQSLYVDAWNGTGNLYKHLDFTIPNLKHLTDLYVDVRKTFERISIPLSSAIPNLKTFGIVAKEILFLDSKRSTWPSTYNLRIDAKTVTWEGIDQQFPNILDFDLMGLSELIFEQIARDLVHCLNLSSLTIDRNNFLTLSRLELRFAKLTRLTTILANTDIESTIAYCYKDLPSLTTLEINNGSLNAQATLDSSKLKKYPLHKLKKLHIALNLNNLDGFLHLVSLSFPNLESLEVVHTEWLKIGTLPRHDLTLPNIRHFLYCSYLKYDSDFMGIVKLCSERFQNLIKLRFDDFNSEDIPLTTLDASELKFHHLTTFETEDELACELYKRLLDFAPNLIEFIPKLSNSTLNKLRELVDHKRYIFSHD